MCLGLGKVKKKFYLSTYIGYYPKYVFGLQIRQNHLSPRCHIIKLGIYCYHSPYSKIDINLIANYYHFTGS